MDFKEYLEQQKTKVEKIDIKTLAEKETSISEKIKELFKEKFDKVPSFSTSSKEKEIRVKFTELVTDGDIRGIVPEIEAVPGIEKVEVVPPEEKEKGKYSLIISLME